MNQERPNVEYGDRDEAMRGEILRSVVGSGVHGTAIAGTDDHDEMGVYIPSSGTMLGVTRHREDYTHRTQPEGVRSGPGDIDLVIYSLQKYLRLAMKGNPTALLPLYAPMKDVITISPLGMNLRVNRHWFLSNEAVERFLGYMHAQHERMMGFGKRDRVPSRPELIEAHGWDVKYGSHALRLAYQGYEIASRGHLTLPLEPETREKVLSVKRGEIPQQMVSDEIRLLEAATKKLLEQGKTAVRDTPDVVAIERFSVAAHLSFWGTGSR